MSAEVIQKISAYFNRAKHPLLLSYLFGSRATGLSRPQSDYDIAILLEGDDAERQMRLYRQILLELAKVIGKEDLDLLLLNGDDSELACKAVCFGKLLYAKDEKVRVDYQARMLNSYFELTDFKRIHRRYLREGVLGTLNLKLALRRSEVLAVLAESGVISKPLAGRLSEAVEMRNSIAELG